MLLPGLKAAYAYFAIHHIALRLTDHSGIEIALPGQMAMEPFRCMASSAISGLMIFLDFQNITPLIIRTEPRDFASHVMME
ncbi:MAG: hypothetical protein C0623_03725 [Desulfuromonas sp.]|nr:MAG: hypothetical protein C0623_03725 [Desulfuromonas sp.]